MTHVIKSESYRTMNREMVERKYKKMERESETATVQCTRRLAVGKDFIWEYRIYFFH